MANADEDTISILVATDCHVGFMEKDPLRYNDSIKTFEEVLKIAQEHDVDMILLGGDLFHDNKPSRKVLHQTIALCRRYCFGDRPCQLEFLSDQSINFSHCKFPVVNYEDPNINVSYPIFSVHGNHDDPTGDGNLSAIDILSSAGLLNHFGKATNVDDIEITPILIQKGQTKLALYGLGSVRDERLNRTFSKGKVKMLRPREDEDEWFNIFVVHQNRSKHGPTNYLPQSYLDDFLDLVIWGHEHECLIDPQWSEDDKPFYITQLGSTVATSLCEGESKKKHVGVLKIHKRAFKMDKIPLQTVRPFLIDDVVLSETKFEPSDDDQVFGFLKEKVEQMIKLATEDCHGNDKCPLPPLVRLKVEYSGGYETINPHRFGQLFVDKVANSKDILHFYRKRKTGARGSNSDFEDGLSLADFDAMENVRIEDLIYEYFNATDQKLQLNVLSERRMVKALKEFVEKEEKDAISELVKWQLSESQKELREKKITETNIDEEISKVKETWLRDVDEEAENEAIEQVLSSSRSRKGTTNRLDVAPEVDLNFDDDDDDRLRSRKRADAETSTGRGRGRGKRGTAARSSAIGDSFISSGTKGRGTRGRRGKSTGAGNNSLLTDSFVVVSKRKSSQRSGGIEFQEDVGTSRSRLEPTDIVELSDDSDSSDPFSMGPRSKRTRKH